MSIQYHVTINRKGHEWLAVCAALRHHGAVMGGETREEALVYIENAIQMILAEMAASGVSAPPDEPAPGSVLLTIADG